MGLEVRLWIAERLRPNGGFEAYYFGTDPEFVDRIDGDWLRLYWMLQRPRLSDRPVRVVNL